MPPEIKPLVKPLVKPLTTPLSENEKKEYKKYIDTCFSTLDTLSKNADQFKAVYSKLRVVYEKSILESQEPDYIKILDSIKQHCDSQGLGHLIQTTRSIVGSGNASTYSVQVTNNQSGSITYNAIAEQKKSAYVVTAKTPEIYPIYLKPKANFQQFFYVFDSLAHAQEVRMVRGWSAYSIFYSAKIQKYSLLIPANADLLLFNYLSQFDAALRFNQFSNFNQIAQLTALADKNPDYFMHALLMYDDNVPGIVAQAVNDAKNKVALVRLIVEKCTPDVLYALFYRLHCLPSTGNIKDRFVPLLDFIKWSKPSDTDPALAPLYAGLTTQLIKKLPAKQIEHLFAVDKQTKDQVPDFEVLAVNANKEHFELFIDLFSLAFLESILLQNNHNGISGMEVCLFYQKASMGKIIAKISAKVIDVFLTKKLRDQEDMNGLHSAMIKLEAKDFMLLVAKASTDAIHIALMQESTGKRSGFFTAILQLDQAPLFALLERADRTLVKTLLDGLPSNVSSVKSAANIGYLKKLLSSEKSLDQAVKKPTEVSSLSEPKIKEPKTNPPAALAQEIDDLPEGDASLFFDKDIYLTGEFTNAPQVQAIYKYVLNKNILVYGDLSLGLSITENDNYFIFRPLKKTICAHFFKLRTASHSNIAINLRDALLQIQTYCQNKHIVLPDVIRFTQIIHVNAIHWISLGIELSQPNRSLSSNLKNQYQTITLTQMDSLSRPHKDSYAIWLNEINDLFLFNPAFQTITIKTTQAIQQSSNTCGFHAAMNAVSFGLTGLSQAYVDASANMQRQYFTSIMDGINRNSLSTRFNLDLTHEDPTTFAIRLAEIRAAGLALSASEKTAYQHYILNRLEAIRVYTEGNEIIHAVYLQLRALYQEKIHLISHPDYRTFLKKMKTRCEVAAILVPIETKQSIVGAWQSPRQSSGAIQPTTEPQKKPIPASSQWTPLTEAQLQGKEAHPDAEKGYRPLYFKMKTEGILEVYFLTQADAQYTLQQPCYKNAKKTIFYDALSKKYKIEYDIELSSNLFPLVDALRICNQFQTIAILLKGQTSRGMAELASLQSDVDGNESLLVKALRFPIEALPLIKLIVETCDSTSLYCILSRALNTHVNDNEISILTVLLCLASEPEYSAYGNIVRDLITKIPEDNLHLLLKLEARNPDESPDFHLIARYARQEHFDQLFDKLSYKFLEKALMVRDPEGVTAFSICQTHKNALAKLIMKVGLPIPMPTYRVPKPVFIGTGLPTPSLSSPKTGKKEEPTPWVALTEAEVQAIVVPEDHPYVPMYLKIKEPGVIEFYFNSKMDAKKALQQKWVKPSSKFIIFYDARAKQVKIETQVALNNLLPLVDALRKTNQFKTIAARFKYQSSFLIAHAAILQSDEDSNEGLLVKALHYPEESYELLQVMVARLDAKDLFAVLSRPLHPFVFAPENQVSLLTVLICLAAEPKHAPYVKIVSGIISKIPAEDLPNLFTLKARNPSESPDFHVVAQYARQDHFEQLINKLSPEYLKSALEELDKEGNLGLAFCEMYKSEQLSKLMSKAGIKAPSPGVTETVTPTVMPRNEEVQQFINDQVLQRTFIMMNIAFKSDSLRCPGGKPIELWEAKECQAWFQAIKNRPKVGLSKTLYYHYPEIYAVLMRATQIRYGYLPRDIQLAALAVFVNSKDKRRLEQVSTGEGKSLIVAMLTVIKILEGDVVDIVTSSPVLAARDAEETRGFYSIFGITVDHNWDEKDGKQYKPGFKPCYKADVVYGAALSFQWDLLREEYMLEGARGSRPYQTVIIDEVDSPSVDGFNFGGQISKMQPAMDHLVFLLEAIWQELLRIEQHMEVGVADKKPIVEKILKEYVLQLINGNNSLVYIPKHLKSFAEQQVDNWVQSVLLARYSYAEGKDYLIVKDKEEGIDVIACMDYEHTGVLHNNMMWRKGLHQFLQIKHGIPLRSESLNAAFISNLGYFSRYADGFYGMTGTLGTAPTQDLLRSVYKVDLVRVPTFKTKQFKELPTQLTENHKFWLDAILSTTLDEVENKRAVLIICETMNDVESIEAKFIAHYGKKPSHISRYSRSDTDECLGFAETIKEGQIIIATNLAGRGTDPKTSIALEQQGGLNVLVTFLPDNQRVLDQAFGRTARQGKLGTARLIIDKEKTQKKFKRYFDPLPELNTIDQLKALRDKIDVLNLNYIKNFRVKVTQLQDTLFSRFCALKTKLLGLNNNQYKFLEVEWRYCTFIEKWMDTIEKEQKINADVVLAEFEAFENAYLQSYQDVDIADPCLLTLDGLDAKDPESAIKKYTKAIEADPVVAMQSYFNRAFSKIAARGAGYKESARADLLKAKGIIEQHYIPHLQARLLILNLSPDAGSGHSGLVKQIEAKINFYQHQIHHIDQTIQVIQQSKSDLLVKAGNHLDKTLDEFKLTKTQQTELYLSGMCHLFELEEEPEENDGLFGILTVVVFGIVQIVAGVVLSTVMPAIGTALISEGIGDLMFAVRASLDGRFTWDAYLATKTTSVAVSVITLGVNTIRANLPANHPLALKTAEATAVASAKPAFSALKGQVIKAVATAGIKEAINFGLDKLSRAALKQFEDDIEDCVSKSVRSYCNRPEVASNLSKLFADDKNNGSFYQLSRLKQLMSELIHCKQGQNKIATNILKGVLANQHSGIASAIKLADIGQALSQVLSFTEDFCQDFAKGVQVYGAALAPSPEDYPELREQLCASISKTVSKSIIKYLHTGVISPATNMVMSEHVDKLSQKIQETCMSIVQGEPKAKQSGSGVSDVSDAFEEIAETAETYDDPPASEKKKPLPKKDKAAVKKSNLKHSTSDFYDLPDLVDSLEDKSPQKVFDSITKVKKRENNIVPLYLGKAPVEPRSRFRGDSRWYYELFYKGIKSRGSIADIFGHAVHNGWGRSAYIPTSTCLEVATSFPDVNLKGTATTYVYDIRSSRSTVDVIDALEKHPYRSLISETRFEELLYQKERAFFENIYAHEIKGCWKTESFPTGDGEFFRMRRKQFIPNPYYKNPERFNWAWKGAKVGGIALTAYSATQDYNSWNQTYQQDKISGDYTATHRESARILGGWSASLAYGVHWANIGKNLAGPYAFWGGLLGGVAGTIFGLYAGEELATTSYDACQNLAPIETSGLTQAQQDIVSGVATSPRQRFSFFQQYDSEQELANLEKANVFLELG